MTIFLFCLAASLAAFIGGYTAIKSRQWLNLAMALTSGLVIGLVAFDLLPEIFEIAGQQGLDPVWPMITLVAGFLLFHLFEKIIPLHSSHEEKYVAHQHPRLGVARAVALCGHSFLDGLSIGVAFQVNDAVGVTVAIAVIGHRFADGFDTTTFMLFNKNKLSHIKGWLALVIVMPILGGLASLAFSLSESTLAIYLGFFAGFVLYIGASNLLPQAHTRDNSPLPILLTLAGAAFMLLVTQLASGL